MFPVRITLSSAGAVVAEVAVTDDKPFVIEADVRPGTHTLYSEPSSKEAGEMYWGAFGPKIQIDIDGRLIYVTNQLINHELRIKLLEPRMLANVNAERPTLRWEAVPGAAGYELTWFEEMPAERRVLKTSQSLKAAGPQYTFEQDVVSKRLYEWDVRATDAAGNSLAHGNAYFLTPGATVEDMKRPGAPPPPPAGSSWLGVSVKEQNAAIAEVLRGKPGLVVEDVLADSPAVAAGLRAGDVILRIGDQPTTTVGEFIGSISALAPGTSVQLTVWRAYKERTVAAVIGKRPVARGAVATQPATQP
jgi:hypothetical protein